MKYSDETILLFDVYHAMKEQARLADALSRVLEYGDEQEGKEDDEA